jgi:hypothetical protein
MNAAQQLASQQTGHATLRPATDIKPGDVIQGINGTAFKVTATERTTDRRGRKVARWTLDGVTQPFDATLSQNIRCWPLEECEEHTNDGTGTCEACGLDLVKASAEAWAVATPEERHAARDEAMRDATLGLRGWN